MSEMDYHMYGLIALIISISNSGLSLFNSLRPIDAYMRQ